MSLARLTELRPWDNVNEEDLYRVHGLYLSIRGNIHQPEGVWCTRDREHAARWVSKPDADPQESDFVYDAQRGEVIVAGLPVSEVEAALELVFNQFEGKPHPGVEFPVWLNPTE